MLTDTTYRVVSETWRDSGWYSHVEAVDLSEARAFGIATMLSIEQGGKWVYYIKLEANTSDDGYVIAVIVNGVVIWAPPWRRVQ